MASRNVEEAWNTKREAWYFWITEVNCENISEKAFFEELNEIRYSDKDFCALDTETKARFLAKLNSDLGLIGRGVSDMKRPTRDPRRIFNFMLVDPYFATLFLSSLLIWLFCPSKQFFVRRGWIDEL